MKNSFRLIAILFLLLMPMQSVLANASVPAPAFNEEEPTPSGAICYGLDIVFLIDQSSSMSGGAGNPANDPQQNRINAPRYALDWLANNRLGLCNQAIHRIGVVSFGGAARVDVDLALTEIRPERQIDWSNQQSDLEGNIQPDDLGATDPMRAFQLADAMLDGAPPLGNELRKRAIILLTDGQPCVSGVGCSFDATDPINTIYLANLVNFVHENLTFEDSLRDQDAAFQAALEQYSKFEDIPQAQLDSIFEQYPVTAPEMFASTYLYIVAMNSSTPYLTIVGKSFGDLSNEYGGQLIDLPNNLNAVPRVFNEILSSLAGVTPTLLGCGNLAVDPYLSGATLDIFKIADGLEVNILHNGKSLSRGQGDLAYFGVNEYGEHGAVEHYRFVQPPAGLWQIDAANCDGIEASYIQFSADVAQTKPDRMIPNHNVPGKTFDENHPFFLEYQIQDKELEKPLNLNPDYPLDLKAIVTAPDGTKTEITMGFVADGKWVSGRKVENPDGTSVASVEGSPIPVNQLGKYSVEVIGMAPCVVDPNIPDRCPEADFEVLRDNQGTYTTGDVEPFQLAVLEPVDQGNIPLHTGVMQGLKNAPINITVQLQDRDGNPTSYDTYITGDVESAIQVTLSANGEVQPVTGITVDTEDPTRLHLVTELPAYQEENILMVDINPDGYDFNKYIPSGLPVVVKFTRADPWYSNVIFWRVARIILLVLLAILLAIFIYNRMNPVRGSLKFTSGESTQSVSLYTGWRKSVVRPSPVVANKLGISRIVAKQVEPQSNTARIQVQLTSAGKVKKTETVSLMENVPMGFGPWAIIYTGAGKVGGKHKKLFSGSPKPKASGHRSTHP